MTLHIDTFKLLLKIKPQLFINKKVLIGNEELKILDVSLDGNYIFVEKSSEDRYWKKKPISELTEDKVVIDIIQEEFDKEVANTKPLSVNALVSFMATNSKLRGNESIDQVQLTDPRFVEQLKAVANTYNIMQELSKSPFQRVAEQVIGQKIVNMADNIINKLIDDKNEITDKLADDKDKITDKLADDKDKITDKKCSQINCG